ncbi:LacI family DNA-binding transcriptional regulator [Bradyrhizobium sp. JYMT SZCCT0180]|uniref:LacI family DNA-binding transcriptional regulator n=1 Tax=Bradyrhizobium sp. JYMT SZCCT0180 TaxID=2807666 RepID=UPI001BACDE24|nr:LacI family DNA-binding transcriptional regulator [Bradyrhizobium sp. JYMT SZCCT0180]MBR1209715.1 LacI family DNA-binding transcriptional regulator [Bradyrhizobium sp. JYMT SZCCT0180]
MADPPLTTFDDVVRIPAPPGRGTTVGRPPRIEEVAERAGVSPITVSRVLRHPEKVNRETRDRILGIIEATGYASNPHARALRSGRSNVVMAFVSNILSQQFGLAVRSFAAALEPEGYEVLVGQTSYSYAREVAMLQSLRGIRPAAVLFTGVIELEENRAALQELAIPVIETWAYPRDPIDMLVGFSNADAGAMAARRLATAGHHRVAFIGRSSGRGALRRDGFRAAAGKLGIEIVHEIAVGEVTGLVDGRTAFGALLARGDPVDAVFCANDLLATGALIEARSRGLSVPRDLALLGFGDNDVADQMTPGLTTIAFDSAAIGRIAGELLLARLAGSPHAVQQHAVELFFVERGSI